MFATLCKTQQRMLQLVPALPRLALTDKVTSAANLYLLSHARASIPESGFQLPNSTPGRCWCELVALDPERTAPLAAAHNEYIKACSLNRRKGHILQSGWSVRNTSAHVTSLIRIGLPYQKRPNSTHCLGRCPKHTSDHAHLLIPPPPASALLHSPSTPQSRSNTTPTHALPHSLLCVCSNAQQFTCSCSSMPPSA